jgi:CheY-like chemotaxis protein
MKVLVVDDNEDIRLLANTLLTMDGHSVVEASDGTTALAILRGDDAPAVVLLDIRIPAPDGLEVLDTIRSEAIPVKVVVFSAHADERTEKEALERDADAFIVKPFTPSSLRNTIDVVVAADRR